MRSARETKASYERYDSDSGLLSIYGILGKTAIVEKYLISHPNIFSFFIAFAFN